MRYQHHHNGFSLVQFAMTLIAVAASAMLAAPLYYRIAHDQWATAQANELVGMLNLARTQAVTQGKTVSVCSSSDGRQCTKTPWQQGYIVFVDEGASGVVDADDAILRQRNARQSPVTIVLNGRSHVRFSPSGATLARAADANVVAASWIDRLSPIGAAHAGDNLPRTVTKSSSGVFTVCAGHAGREVKLSPQGFVSTSTIVCQ
jgi:type IV fimbrial biogenesis protein FimT